MKNEGETTMKKPIIGITSNFTTKDEVGKITHLGASLQQWQLLADDYIKAIELAGGVPMILPIVENFENLIPVLEVLDGLIMTGGNDVNPLLYNKAPESTLGEICIKRDNAELGIFQKALNDFNIPIMGICRGCQLLNVIKGGTLHQDLVAAKVTEREHFLANYPINYATQIAKIKPESKLHEIFRSDEIRINSFHHQGIDKLGDDLVITASGEDGVVEAIEQLGDRFVMGLQWHPEMLSGKSNNSYKLFEAFVAACAKER